MTILYSILFIIAFISFIAPFIVWAWTNFTKAREVMGIVRFKFILWSWLISWSIFIISILSIALIVIS